MRKHLRAPEADSHIGLSTSTPLTAGPVASFDHVMEGGQVTNNPASRPERFISDHEVQSRTNLSRTTIWRLERLGKFPRSFRLSAGRRGRLESQIDAWINARVAEGSS
jgi:prophage regulatory protein